MATRNINAYRSIVREVNQASIYPRTTRPPAVRECLRAIFEQQQGQSANPFVHDMHNAATFLRSQRMHKTLLERYNPTLGLSTEERVKKTANRVGLDMPVGPKDEE